MNSFDKTSIRITFRITPSDFAQLHDRLSEWEEKNNDGQLFAERLTANDYVKLLLKKHLYSK